MPFASPLVLPCSARLRPEIDYRVRFAIRELDLGPVVLDQSPISPPHRSIQFSRSRRNREERSMARIPNPARRRSRSLIAGLSLGIVVVSAGLVTAQSPPATLPGGVVRVH